MITQIYCLSHVSCAFFSSSRSSRFLLYSLLLSVTLDCSRCCLLLFSISRYFLVFYFLLLWILCTLLSSSVPPLPHSSTPSSSRPRSPQAAPLLPRPSARCTSCPRPSRATPPRPRVSVPSTLFSFLSVCFYSSSFLSSSSFSYLSSISYCAVCLYLQILLFLHLFLFLLVLVLTLFSFLSSLSWTRSVWSVSSLVFQLPFVEVSLHLTHQYSEFFSPLTDPLDR